MATHQASCSCGRLTVELEGDPVRVSVNIAPRVLLEPGLADRITLRLSEIGLLATAQRVLGALAFCHVDRRGDNLYELSSCREHGQDVCIDVFDRPIWQFESELVLEASPFVQCALDISVDRVDIVWMDPSPHGFAVRETLDRIKPPDAVTLLRPIENFRRSRT